MQLKHGSTIKGYKILDRITEGGFGEVYSAHHTTVNRDVAIKVILPQYANTPDFIRRFEAEAQVIARLEHPYIVPLYDYWRDPMGAYLVMRLLRGGSLKELIKQQGALSLEDTASILEQICQALHIAHRNQVIHRDIKPGNILLDEDGNAYLADFGIAKDHGTTNGVTNPEGIVGSPDYLSPEQARSEPVTPQTDIYSLGVVLYEMLMGEHPFPNLNPIERLYRHLNDLIPEISGMDDHLTYDINVVIQNATAKNPKDRYEDALALARAFREASCLDRTPTPISMVELLTPREQEVLKLIIDGKTNRQISEKLVVEVSTVKWYINQIYKKLGVRSRVQAIVKARDLDLINIPAETSMSISVSNIPEPDNPYKGLRAFQSADAQYFFGREKLTSKLLSRVQEKVDYQRFLAVVGPSGSGKSSVVKAGLIPEIWRGAIPQSDNWYIVDMIPGDQPMDELEVALLRIAADSKINLREQLERDHRGLLRVSDLILPDDGSELLIVIDQFEEVFTLLNNEDQRQHFLALIQEAVTAPRSRIRVIVTLRADYYDKPLQYPDFGELMRNRVETILPLSAEELERAVHEPAKRVGVRFEDGLVSRIVSDVHYQPGALPLLQYAMTELFERHENRLLKMETYQAIGGTGGALANRADEIFNDYDESGQELVRQMFLRLVTLGEGAEDTRRRVERAELLAITDKHEVMDDIIDTYAQSRLLSLDHDPTTRQPTVEVAHEAILREWDRLRQWLNRSREDIRQERLIAQAAQAWQDNGKDESYLLSGTRLEQAQKWREITELALTPLEIQFIQTSISVAQSQEKAEAERQAREITLEKRSRNFLRGLVVVMLIAIIVVSGMALVAFQERNSAQRESAINLSFAQANSAARVFENGQRDLALALSLEAVNIDDPPQQAIQIFRELSSEIGTQLVFEEHDTAILDAKLNADGSRALSVACSVMVDENKCLTSEVLLWDTTTGEVLQRADYEGKANSLAWHPSGQQIALARESGEVLNINTKTFEELRHFSGHESMVNSVDFNADGHLLISGDQDGEIILWDVESAEVLQRLEAHTGAINSTIFSPDSSMILSASDDMTLRLWDVESGENIRVFEGHTDRVISGLFHPNMEHIYSASDDQRTYVWDITNGELLNEQHVGAPINDLAMSTDGQFILDAVRLGVGMTDTATLLPSSAMKTFDHRDTVLTIDISQDMQFALSGSADGELRVWNLQPRNNMRRFEGGGMPLWRISVSHDEKTAITGGFSGEAIVWDIETGQEIRRFDDNLDFVSALAFSADDAQVLIGSSNSRSGMDTSEVVLRDIKTGEVIRRFEGLDGGVNYGIYDTGTNRILASSQMGANDKQGSGELLIWDADTEEILLEIQDDQGIGAISLSPDRSMIATGSSQKNGISIWDSETGDLLQYWETEDLIADVEFLPDGKYLLSSSWDSQVLLWDVETGEVVRSFIGHTWVVWSVAASDDGRLASTTSADQRIIVWDIASGEELYRFNRVAISVSDAVFIENDTKLLTSDYGGNVREWELAEVDIIELKQWVYENRHIHQLTCKERLEFRVSPPCVEDAN